MKIRLFITILLLMLLSTACSDTGGINLFSIEQDVELGKQLRSEIMSNPQQYPVLDRNRYTPSYTYLEGVVADILKSGQVEHAQDFPWEVYLIQDDNTLNAFAAPGGYIFVYTGLIKFLDQKDDFAGVLAHEIAHADRRHSTRQLTKAYGISFLIDVILGDKQSAATDILQSLVSLQFTRSDEAEADQYSVTYLCNTDYAANGAASFFQKMIDQGQGSGLIPEFLSTHPNPDNRVSAINAEATAKGCNMEFDSSKSSWQSFQNSLP
jgi:predicted Zn-dependent protease